MHVQACNAIASMAFEHKASHAACSWQHHACIYLQHWRPQAQQQMLTHRARTPSPSWGLGRWDTAALARLLLAAAALPAVQGLASSLSASASGAAALLQVHLLASVRLGLSLPLYAAGKPAHY